MNKTDCLVVGQLINNFRFPLSFPRENIEFALNYKRENGDRFIVSYPKCGTTWTQQIICLIINSGIIEKTDRQYIINSFLERKGKESLNTSLKPRVIKTHIPFELIPYNMSAKYLCVLRNPKDNCVSYYYHTKSRAHNQFTGHFHEYFNSWIEGDLPYGDYFQHVLSFWSHRFDDNFSFLVNEHMKTNPKYAVLKIAKFLGE
jgi:hypothetical protein